MSQYCNGRKYVKLNPFRRPNVKERHAIQQISNLQIIGLHKCKCVSCLRNYQLTEKDSLTCTQCKWNLCNECSKNEDTIKSHAKHHEGYPWENDTRYIDLLEVKHIPKHRCNLWAFNNLEFQERKGH